MTDAQQSNTSEGRDQPGKTRTWWHPLLVRLLNLVLDSAYEVQDEVLVGKLPLRVDILLVRREAGQLSEDRQRELSALVPLLNRYTLIEFKAPTDLPERGDFAQLVGCSYLWHSQQSHPIPGSEISLMVLTPMVNRALREELQLFSGCEAIQHEPGVFRVTGLPFATWLVETDVMAERGQPVLSLVSRVFLSDHRRIIEMLTLMGRDALVHYLVQQVQQFANQGEPFAMQHRYSGNLKEFGEQILTELLETVPAERRLRGLPPEERVRGLPPEELVRVLPPEERLRGLPPEERMKGLSLEDRLAGLSEEEAAQLRELLERRQSR
jgi:hypothetical protein